RENTNNTLPIAVDVPFSYEQSAIGEFSDHVELFVILTYDAEGNSLDSTADIVDTVAAKMGEIRAAGGDALIGIAVGDDFMVNESASELLEGLQNYYAEDSAFMGTEIVVYSEYLNYAEVSDTNEESSPIPGFGIVLSFASLLALAFIVRKR
ncbi:MAG: PGF-CTERM sorting domain-containing protein, partial [Desulfobacterales bacterium]|nr:PGF-CTERM sorting domain-containing protein [Desulfobacterales bacterium]